MYGMVIVALLMFGSVDTSSAAAGHGSRSSIDAHLATGAVVAETPLFIARLHALWMPEGRESRFGAAVVAAMGPELNSIIIGPQYRFTGASKLMIGAGTGVGGFGMFGGLFSFDDGGAAVSAEGFFSSLAGFLFRGELLLNLRPGEDFAVWAGAAAASKGPTAEELFDHLAFEPVVKTGILPWFGIVIALPELIPEGEVRPMAMVEVHLDI